MKYKYKLYGAILGDLAGQPFEFPAMKGPYENVNIHNPLSHITDDSIMTLAGAWSIIENTSVEIAYKYFGREYPDAGYGKGFKEWLKEEYRVEYGTSWGNGCLMRASPFMYLKDPLPKLIESVMCSHHNTISYESVLRLYNIYIKGCQKNVGCLHGFSKFEVVADKTVDFIEKLFSRDWRTKESIIFAVQCGGDTDTNASIIGELCNFHYQDITEEDAKYVESKLDDFQLNILKKFNEKFND